MAARVLLAGIVLTMGAADRAVAASSGREPSPPSPSRSAVQVPGESIRNGAAAATDPGVDPEVRWLASILRMKGADAAIRRGAAERLLRLASPPPGAGRRAADEALAELAGALRNGGPRDGDDPASAVLEAVQSVGVAPAELALPMIELARRLPSDRRDPVRAAAARLEGAAASVVGPVAWDPSREMPDRLAAIWLLGAMRAAESVDALVSLLDPAREQPTPIVDAACDQLERLLERGFGRDAVKWRRWWTELPGDAGAAGERSLLGSLRARILQLESSLQRRQREVDEVASRLAATTGELFLTLASTARQERTIVLLADPLPSLREFALTQVDRLLRNGEVPVEPLQLALLERLDDPQAELRIRTLKLLGDIGRPQLSEEISPAFARESDPGVIAAYLSLLQRQPSPTTFERLAELLEDPVVGEDAARAIVRLVEDDLLFGAWQDRVRDVTRRLVDASALPAGSGAGASTTNAATGAPASLGSGAASGGANGASGSGGAAGTAPPSGSSVPTGPSTSPSSTPTTGATPNATFVRLLGAAGNDDDLRRIEAMLGSPDPSVRRGAADALRLRGRRDTLLPLAGDEAVYPALVRGLSDSPVDLDRLRRVLTLVPPSAATQPDRDVAVRRILTSLPPSDLATADDLVAAAGRAAGWPTDRLRIDGLARMAEPAADEIPMTIRRDLLVRLSRLLTRNGDPRRAIVVLDRLGSATDPDVDRARFEAALVDRQYDRAAALNGKPGPWIELLEELVGRRSAAAGGLRDEILRRFSGEMNTDERSKIDGFEPEIIAIDRSETAKRGSAGPTGQPTGPPGGSESQPGTGR